MFIYDDTLPTQRVHGGAIESELRPLGIGLDRVLDFSINTNPYGPCPSVVAAARAAVLERYPDSSASEVRAAIATVHDLDPEQVVVGNGAADLLWTLARLLVKDGEHVVIADPTFSEFRAAALSAGAKVDEWRASAQHDFAIDLHAMSKKVRETGARVVYLASPNTPTGAAVSVGELAEFTLEHPSSVFVIDQSFLMLSERREEFNLPMPSNVVRVRSLTKDHAIPGLRIGYVLTAEPLARQLEVLRPAWTTSAVAQAAALAAMQESEFVCRSWLKLREDCRFLAEALRKLGLRPFPTSTHFFLVETGHSAELRTNLLRHEILVRDCTSFGLPGFIRLSARPEADCRRLIAALEKELR